MERKAKGQEGRAINRYEHLKALIKQAGKIPVVRYEAYMFEKFGVRESTVARYIRTMAELGYIKIEADLVMWLKK